MKRIFVVLFLVIITTPVVLYLISPVQPIEWRPDINSSLTGAFLKNNKLNSASLIGENVLIGPEDISFDDQGWLYTGLADGRIVKLNPQKPDHIQEVANTGGRPLGLRFHNNGDLIVADAIKGLLAVDKQGQIKVLSDSFNGKKMMLVDHVDIAKNGDIYFSDASMRFPVHDFLNDFIEASATGRVFKYSYATKQTELVLDGLFFSNGIALGPEDAYVLVAETGRSRILKHHLKGTKQSQTEVFIDSLPGMPDNIYFNDDDTFWVGLIVLRDWRVEKLAAFPTIRRIIGGLPRSWVQPKNAYGFVIGLNSQAEVTHNYQTESTYTLITAAVEHNNKLYLGSLVRHSIAVFDELEEQIKWNTSIGL